MKFFKGCLPQNLLSPLMNTFSYMLQGTFPLEVTEPQRTLCVKHGKFMKFEVTKMGRGPTIYHIRILQGIFSLEVIESQRTPRQE